MIHRMAALAVLPLSFAAVAQEPQPAEPAPAVEATAPADAGAAELPDWKEEEEALLREAAARGIKPDTKAAALAAANERPGFNGYLPDVDEHVLSHSRLFSVSGGDSLRMGAIATRADGLYAQVCNLLDVERKHKHLIAIRLLGKSTDSPSLNPIRTRINIIDNQPHFQVRVYPGGGIDLDRLDKAIIAMILYEHALRDVEPGAFPESMGLPAWLVAGVQQAVLWKTKRAERRIYQELFKRAEMLSPQEIISVEKPEKLDATSRQVYEVSCGVLMMSLLAQDGGLNQVKTMLSSVATSDDSPLETITNHFHELGIDASLLNKWWAIELANLATPSAMETLPPIDSEKMLQEALTVTYFDPETEVPRQVSVDEVYALVELPDWQKLVQPVEGRLVQLLHKCFPGYRPIVSEYSRVLRDLADGAHPDTVQNTLGPLNELRGAYYSAAVRGRDYLDWFEISFTGKQRGRSFDSYLETMQLLRRDHPGADTPMSRYLDDIEALYTQKEGAPLPEALRRKARENHEKKRK